MNPETNIQPQKNTEPNPLNNTENNTNQAVTPDPQSQIQKLAPPPADPQADQFNNPPAINDDNNQISQLPETPITPDITNQNPENQTPVQEPVTPPAFSIPEPTTPLDSEAQPPNGSMVGRKRILYISTASLAGLAIVAGVVFGFVLPDKKPQTSSTNVASKTSSSSQNNNAPQTQSTSSGGIASNSSNATSSTKKSAASAPLPFSDEKEEVLPVDNNVPESDPTNQPGDPTPEADLDDTVENY